MLWLNIPGQRPEGIIADLQIELKDAYESIQKVFKDCKKTAIGAECFLCAISECPHNTQQTLTPDVFKNLVTILTPNELLKFVGYIAQNAETDLHKNAEFIVDLIHSRGEIYYGEDY